MRVLPILFNTPMVQAIMEGRKTVTRRVIKPQPNDSFDQYWEAVTDENGKITFLKAPYRPGDILYVRETWAEWTGGYVYKADGASSPYPLSFVDRWRPSIHMPKEAARIFLRVSDVRAERLQEPFFAPGCPILELQREGIDFGDQCRECIETYGLPCCIDDESECGVLDDVRGEFTDLWDGTIKLTTLGAFGWAANPWVWVTEFERCEKPEGCP